MVKNVPKSKNSIYFIKSYVLHMISLDFNSFLSQTLKKDGDTGSESTTKLCHRVTLKES